jgi:hypothetical protein
LSFADDDINDYLNDEEDVIIDENFITPIVTNTTDEEYIVDNTEVENKVLIMVVLIRKHLKKLLMKILF